MPESMLLALSEIESRRRKEKRLGKKEKRLIEGKEKNKKTAKGIKKERKKLRKGKIF